jgi:hypothetical protein
MIARAPFHPLRLFALLLLATIGLQALAPVPVPFERGHGSAFSSGTLDVAVASSDRATAAKATAGNAKPAWTGPLHGPPCATCLPQATTDANEDRPLASGPTRRSPGPPILDLIPSPRAPPIS